MRKYQMSIIFGVYDGTRSDEDSNELHVYADGNNIWGVICGGFQRLVNALVETGKHLPISFGCCEHEWKGQGMRIRPVIEVDAEIVETIKEYTLAYKCAQLRTGPHCYGWMYPEFVPIMNKCTSHLTNLQLERNRSKMREWERRAGIKKG